MDDSSIPAGVATVVRPWMRRLGAGTQPLSDGLHFCPQWSPAARGLGSISRSELRFRFSPRSFALPLLLALAGCEPPPGQDVPDAYRYDITSLRDASVASTNWSEASQIPLSFRDPRAIATGADGATYAAGDRAIVAIGPDGKEIWRCRLEEEPGALGVGPDGSLYAGLRHHVAVVDSAGKLTSEWVSLGERSVITSVAPGKDRVWVADAGSRKVAIFDPGGRLLGYLEPPEPFVAPSPFFDLAADTGGGVWVVNPGCLRVEHYSAEGKRTGHWGRPSMEPSGFAGCCNPIHVALMGDGTFATAEKGIPRVKAYAADGTFLDIIAGPGLFAEDTHGLDLAAGRAGAILVLDRERRCIRVFTPRENSP